MKKTLLIASLLAISTYSFADIKDCALASANNEYQKILEECAPYSKKDFRSTVMLGLAQVHEKMYKKGLSNLNWAINNSKPNSDKEALGYAYATVGNLIYTDEIGKQNKAKSLEYLTKAANLGNDIAQKQLAGMYVSGQNGDLKQNFTIGYKWTKLAIANGSQEAKNGYLNVNLDGFKKEAPYCIAMGEQLVAQAYIDGSAGLSKDTSKAKKYLNDAIALYKDNEPTKENLQYCPEGADKLNLESAKKQLDSI